MIHSKIIVIFTVLLLCSNAFAAKDHLEINLGYKAPAPRWQYEKAQLPKRGYALSLYRIKKSYTSEQQSKCYTNSLAALKQSKTASGWVAVYRLRCARETTAKNKLLWIKQSIDYINNNPKLLLSGGHVTELRQELIQSLILMARNNMRNLTRASQYLDQALVYRQWMNKEDVAFVYELMGDISFNRRKNARAYFYYKSAVEAMSQKSLLKKVEAAKSRLEKTDFEEFEPPKQNPIVEEHETNIYNQFNTALKKGQIPHAVEIGVNYLNSYNHGFYQQEIATDIRKELNTAFRRNRISLFEKLLSRAKKAPQYFLSQWGDYFYERARSLPAYHMYKESLAYGQGKVTTAKDLFRSAYSAYQIGEYDYSKASWQKVVETASGSEYANLSLYYLGLVNLRLNKNQDSIEAFDKYIHSGNDEFRLQALHWGWRQLQKLEKNEEADKWKAILIKEFSLTYYGLRAQIESGNKELIFVNHNKVPKKLVYWFSGYEKESWNRVQVLLQAGWLKEANRELKTWNDPVTATEKLVMAHLYSLAMNHLDAILLTQEVFEKYPTWKRMETLALVYPQEFSAYIDQFSGKHKLENHLIKALIKQESSYLTFVSSPMGAMGLMQLMRPTAVEMNRLLRLKPLKIPDDLEQPKRNIRLGTYYLNRLVRAFDGHVPLALASYNVGIGNMRKWQGQRKETESILTLDPKDPMSELWIDELAWSETSFYVKAILRNLIVYRWLDKGQVSAKMPVWSYAGRSQN